MTVRRESHPPEYYEWCVEYFTWRREETIEHSYTKFLRPYSRYFSSRRYIIATYLHKLLAFMYTYISSIRTHLNCLFIFIQHSVRYVFSFKYFILGFGVHWPTLIQQADNIVRAIYLSIKIWLKNWGLRNHCRIVFGLMAFISLHYEIEVASTLRDHLRSYKMKCVISRIMKNDFSIVILILAFPLQSSELI